MDPRDRIITGLLFTLAYDWNVHRRNRNRVRDIAEERNTIIDRYNDLVTQYNDLIGTLAQRETQVEYLVDMLDKNDIEPDEFDIIALNNPISSE
jgi:N-methylhydantoinase B/oxoprolinase/acetone carboxylase alpha subunit